jgi:hAT family C-terminal dimerisation region
MVDSETEPAVGGGADVDYDDEESVEPESGDASHGTVPPVVTSHRKRNRRSFPWEYTCDWQESDGLANKGKRQCTVCKNWFSGNTNASGWKTHLSTQHSIYPDNSLLTPSPGDKLMIQSQLQSSFTKSQLRRYENAVVDFVIEGGVSLRFAGGDSFKKFVSALTTGYEPPSTRTILRRISELHRIMEPMLAKFLGTLDVSISLTMDGWSNRNLKGFYVVTAHWVDTSSLSCMSILLTILDVKSGSGVGRRVGQALFDHLKRLGLGVMQRILNITTDNGSDATAAVKQFFQLANTFVGADQFTQKNNILCADHSVQLCVVKVTQRIKPATEALRDALVKIRRSKVMRQTYREEATKAELGSKEPPHPDSPTRWNSSHVMCSDSLSKRIVLDTVMDHFKDDLGRGALTEDEWQAIRGVAKFLEAPRECMERVAADLKPTLDLVPMCVTVLIQHCIKGEEALAACGSNLTAVGMKDKLMLYEPKLVQEPAIIASYLNPQLPKPADASELKHVTDRVRDVLQRRYPALLNGEANVETGDPGQVSTSLFASILRPSVSMGAGGAVEEINKYLSMGVVQSDGFLDVLSWWSTRKAALPGHYQMAMDYFGSQATSTPSERANSVAGREFISTRQSLSSSVFVMTMCVRSWMRAGILKVPADRAGAMAHSSNDKFDAEVEQLEIEQADWNEEVLDDGVVKILNNQFEDLVMEAEGNV